MFQGYVDEEVEGEDEEEVEILENTSNGPLEMENGEAERPDENVEETKEKELHPKVKFEATKLMIAWSFRYVCDQNLRLNSVDCKYFIPPFS